VAWTAEMDGVRRVVVAPRIARAYWSQRCAWPGDRVQLTIETRHVPDATEVEVRIVEDDTGEGSEDDPIATLAPAVITDNKCVIEYEVKWHADDLGAQLELEGDRYEFRFDVEIPLYELAGRSNAMYVPVEPFGVSR
jgi:hypothetical protein